MNCKNCNHPLEEHAHFCDNCGAKVVKERINFKELVVLFVTDIFGVDSRFFRTLKEMAIHPDKVLHEYLSGVRKRYVNPFGFFAVAVGISLIVFNYFEEEFLKVNAEINKTQTAELKKDASIDLSAHKELSKNEFNALKLKKQTAELQLKFMEKYMNFMLNYYNIVMFLFLPFYGMLSKWTYPKPHNYGEHIIMNTYIIGFTTFVALLFFSFSLLIHPSIYTYNVLFIVVFYLFAFGKLYKKNFFQTILKLLKFLLSLLIVIVILGILIVLAGLILAK